jgi:hypothetical protein
MPNVTENDDEPWTGRPQDDPALRAAVDKRIADFRREHPPVTCWIDKVQTIELYLDGVRRALITRSRALILFYDGAGAPTSSVVYLRSENPYDVAEAHLGIARISEVRDESAEAGDILSAAPRAQEDREALDFRSRHYRDVEIFHYLRSAVKLLQHEQDLAGARSPIIELLLQAISAEVQDQHAQALTFVQQAAAALESRDGDLMFGELALADCWRAIVAIERHVAVQSRRPLRHTPGGKSGG